MPSESKSNINKAIHYMWAIDVNKLHELIVEVTAKDNNALSFEERQIVLDIRRHTDALNRSLAKWHEMYNKEKAGSDERRPV